MDRPEINSVESRLARLEEENRRLAKETRRLKAFGTSALLVAVALMTMGAGMALQDVNASRLAVMDVNGRTRFVVGQIPADNRGVLNMHDQNGKVRVEIAVSDDGYCGIRVFNANGQETWRSP